MAAAIWAFVISNPLLSRAGHGGGSDPSCPRSLLLREQVDVRVNSAPAHNLSLGAIHKQRVTACKRENESRTWALRIEGDSMTSVFADHVERDARRILRQRIERLP